MPSVSGRHFARTASLGEALDKEEGDTDMSPAEFALDIGAALLMGVAIGLERQWRQHTAGLRTNALVCLGAALFVSLSRLLSPESSPTRIAAQVVSGMGFLGGGVILREGLNVRGMNTAATLWCSGAVGTLAGAGYAVYGLVGTAAVLAVHLGLRPLGRWVDARSRQGGDVETLYRLRVVCRDKDEGLIRTILLRHVNSHPPLLLQGISTQEAEQPEWAAVVAEVFSTGRNDRAMEAIMSRLNIEPGVRAVSWERAP
jgi:putative Mg2+ transporter-C (MgtC) family protein